MTLTYLILGTSGVPAAVFVYLSLAWLRRRLAVRRTREAKQVAVSAAVERRLYERVGVTGRLGAN